MTGIWDTILAVLNTEFFAGLATLLTGGVAIGVFFQQKRDEKMKAARVILQEIRNAESKVSIISEKLNSNSTSDLPSVLPTNNWNMYAHLFVADFDSDELKVINEFYDSCQTIHEAAQRNNNFFWITTEERARVTEHVYADMVKTAETPEEHGAITTALDKISNHGYQYIPRKTLEMIRFHISSLTRVTTSSCGQKLKSIARLRA